MIYCNLKGGLGNMMFQMASTVSFSLEKKDNYSFPNLFDQINYLNNETTYNPNLNYANEYSLLFNKLNSTPIEGSPKVIHFPFHYEKNDLNYDSIIIDGFFQSEKYFLKHKNEILDLFDFESICGEYVNKKYDYKKFKTTSIHVRRGDYLKYPNHHPSQTIEYYKKAIEILKNDTDLFLVFSDDIEWCKNNLNFIDPIYIENEKDYNELYLMSLCDNNIISNSSFSWWGAWLNKNKDKKVIGPSVWFGNAIREKTDDIIPEDWMKI